MQYLMTTYSKYLWTTGGRLSLDKCYWYLMQSVRGKDGIYKLLPVKNCRHDMILKEEDVNGVSITIPQLEPGDARRGLGITGAPDGKWKLQRAVLIDKARLWATSIRASALNAAEIWTAYSSVLWPGLAYPLAITSFSVADLHLVQQKVSRIIRNSLHLNKSFPDALFYGAKKYGGLGIVPLIAQQCILKLLLFLRHIRSNDDIRRQLLISMGYTRWKWAQMFNFFGSISPTTNISSLLLGQRICGNFFRYPTYNCGTLPRKLFGCLLSNVIMIPSCLRSSLRPPLRAQNNG